MQIKYKLYDVISNGESLGVVTRILINTEPGGGVTYRVTANGKDRWIDEADAVLIKEAE